MNNQIETQLVQMERRYFTVDNLSDYNQIKASVTDIPRLIEALRFLMDGERFHSPDTKTKVAAILAGDKP